MLITRANTPANINAAYIPQGLKVRRESNRLTLMPNNLFLKINAIMQIAKADRDSKGTIGSQKVVQNIMAGKDVRDSRRIILTGRGILPVPISISAPQKDWPKLFLKQQ